MPGTTLWNRLQREDRKVFVALYLGALIILAAWRKEEFAVLFRVGAMIGLYAVADLLWSWLRERRTYLPLSSIVSALVGGVVLAPGISWAVTIIFSLLAVGLKHTLRLRGRHVFNPAAASLFLISLAVPQSIAWWAVAWWTTPFKILGLLCGLVLVTRIRRWSVVWPFALAYSAGLFLALAPSSAPLGKALSLLFDGTVIFFATVMLVEPVTTSYRTRRITMLYGAGVGLLAVFLPLSRLPLPNGLDGFLPPLLLGNFLAAAASLRQKPVAGTTQRKEDAAAI